jgi:Asp-tRNA(Asn)/Glu-tRNA(Gln) amidotransferase B subunit
VKVLNFLFGQVMRRTGGKASPQVVRERLTARIAKP